MRALTASEARANIYRIIDETAQSHEPIIISGKRTSAVLLSAADWNAIQETLYLLAVPGTRESIKASMAEPLAKSATALKWWVGRSFLPSRRSKMPKSLPPSASSRERKNCLRFSRPIHCKIRHPMRSWSQTWLVLTRAGLTFSTAWCMTRADKRADARPAVLDNQATFDLSRSKIRLYPNKYGREQLLIT